MVILFDFDGTMVDTWPDLKEAFVRLLDAHVIKSNCNIDSMRHMVAAGSSVMLKQILPNNWHCKIPELREDLFKIYLDLGYKYTQLFTGMQELLELIIKRDIKWGIVTNRLSYLTTPIINKLGLPNPAVLVCADQVANPKPHPEPLLMAASLLNIAPKNCIYIGDAATDIIAGNCAGMKTGVATFGYIKNLASAYSWPANFRINKPKSLLNYLHLIS